MLVYGLISLLSQCSAGYFRCDVTYQNWLWWSDVKGFWFIYFKDENCIQLLSSMQFWQNQSVATCHQKIKAEKQWIKLQKAKQILFWRGQNTQDTLKLMHWLSVIHFLLEDRQIPSSQKNINEEFKQCHKM